MPDSVTALIGGAIGGAVATVIQYGLRRYEESEKVRREVIETHLLQLQNSVESVYYRAINLLKLAGRKVMPDEYFVQTSAYALGRLLAHESLLVSKGVYAKIYRNAELKRNVKSWLHYLNWEMDHGPFFHYRRLQLGEMVLDGERMITYTEFRIRWTDPAFSEVVKAVSWFVEHIDAARMERISEYAKKLIDLLAEETKVPSALELSKHPLIPADLTNAAHEIGTTFQR